MKQKIARCGYRCDLCPAFRENLTGEEDPQKVSDKWFEYYGFRIPPEEIYCDGCLPEDSDNPRRIDPDCAVRACVRERGLPNCAHCDEYICDKLRTKMVDFEEVVRKHGTPVPPEDHTCYMKPYEAKRVLDRIREGLGNLK